MDDEEKKLASFLKEAEVKIVWREEEKTKVGRGMITNDDKNFVYLTGEKERLLLIKRTLSLSNSERFHD